MFAKMSKNPLSMQAGELCMELSQFLCFPLFKKMI